MRRARRRPAYAKEQQESRAPRSVTDPVLLHIVKTTLTMLLNPYVTPDDLEHFRYLLAEVEIERLFAYHVGHNAATGKFGVVVSFTLRGQEACDKLWGSGGTPNPFVRRFQIEGEIAAELPFSQVAFSEIPAHWAVRWNA